MASFNFNGQSALALRDALTTHRAAVLQQLTITLANLPALQKQHPPALAARRLAGIFYGNLTAALTFGTFSTFAHDIDWHLSLIEQRNLGVTLNDERAMFVAIADAISTELPEHREIVDALFAQVVALMVAARAGGKSGKQQAGSET